MTFDRCNAEKFVKDLRGENDVEAALQRLDRLTLDEVRATTAQTLEVVCSLVPQKVDMDGGSENTLSTLPDIRSLLNIQTSIPRRRWIGSQDLRCSRYVQVG
jgi:hypothetical protein